MKRISIALLLLLLAVPSWARMGVGMMGGGMASIGATCSGDASVGDNESFEKGEGEFCTTDWTEADTDGVVDTYSSAEKHCGATSLEITTDLETAGNNNRAYIDLGASDQDFYVRFYVKIPSSLSNYKADTALTVSGNGTSTTQTHVYIIIGRMDSTYYIKIRQLGENPTEYVPVTAGNWYRVDAHIVKSGDSTIRVYDVSDNPILTSNGGSDYEQAVTFASGDNYQRYIVFSDKSTDSVAHNFYIDDVAVEIDGTGYIGAQSCE